ncbi:hypothetical protein [Actimicrobium sp. CCI2.3]|uniref:hypothetical protein n=1 Tax=Actimicrobium sp. CCI2.3 TaxID=3048616 RepID=UPI002AB3DF36|nr:hypothetical protein [Actimicrobium sp. CCI2.3]MDY7574361.1 hypothetical protein [Actimicrobium sp. CCI2.3]MEB0023522.1 hypothetical protein [Actimicrobium sp. CCI2.3]
MKQVTDRMLHSALRAAVAYLTSHQADDGHWQDYRLPVGRSDAWVTGYVGVALAQSDHSATVRRSTDAAANWLEKQRPYPQGWGYNRSTGPDADSSAFALTLLRLAGKTPLASDVTWLREHWHGDGGFATYARDDAWGVPHNDVTPAVFLALPPVDQMAYHDDVLEVLARERNKDGTWPSYWWRTCHYATWWSLRLLRALGMPPEGRPPVVGASEQHAIHGAFDLALVTGIASLQHAQPELISALAGKLITLQRADGAWAGGANLRVTDPCCYQPWSGGPACGRLYADENHLVTTATALQVLAEMTKEIPTQTKKTTSATIR